MNISMQIIQKIADAGVDGISFVTLKEQFPSIGDGAIIHRFEHAGIVQRAIGVPQYRAIPRVCRMYLDLPPDMTEYENLLHEANCDTTLKTNAWKCNCGILPRIKELYPGLYA